MNTRKLFELADRIHADQYDFYSRTYPGTHFNTIAINTTAWVRPGSKYTKIDVGSSGKFMIDADGNIYGIKGYGVIHRGKRYGTLDTIENYYWGNYSPAKKVTP